MKALLKKCDFCCSIVGLNYGGYRRYKSPVGGVLSICIFIGFLIVLIYYLTDFFNRSTTKMSFENQKYWDPPKYDLSDNFTLAVMMEYGGEWKFNDSLVKVEAYYQKQTLNGTTIEKIDKIPCKREDYIGNEEVFDHLNLDKAICFNFKGLSIQGSSVNEIFSYVQIKFILCLNDTVCPNARASESIFHQLKPLAYIYFLDTVFQGNKKNQKVIHFINYLEVNVTYSNSKVTNVYFANNEMQIDTSYFFPSPPTKYVNYNIDSFRDLVSVRTPQQTEALSIDLMSSKNKQIIKISFMQLSELIANIAALVNIIIFIFTGIGEYVNNFFFQNDLMGELYFLNNDSLKNNRTLSKYNMFNDIETSPKLKFPNTKKTMAITGERISEEVAFEVTSQNKVKKNFLFSSKVKVEKQKILSNKKKADNEEIVRRPFSIMEILLLSINSVVNFCPKITYCKKLNKKFEKVQKHIFLIQDLLNMFRKLQEIDLIKYLLFNEQQLNLYQIIPRPLLYLDEVKNPYLITKGFSSFYSSSTIHYLKTRKQIVEILQTNNALKKSLSDIMAKKNKTDTDEKLLKILEERLFPLK